MLDISSLLHVCADYTQPKHVKLKYLILCNMDYLDAVSFYNGRTSIVANVALGKAASSMHHHNYSAVIS